MSCRRLSGARDRRKIICSQDASTSNYRRTKSVGRATTDYGANLTNSPYISRSLLSLKKRGIFDRTPAKIKISQNPDLQEEAGLRLRFIVNKQWTLYSVTPLHKFSYGQLQEYSKQLSKVITAQKEKRFILEGETDLMFQAKFSSFSVLKTTGKKQAAVLIEVIASIKEDERKNIYLRVHTLSSKTIQALWIMRRPQLVNEDDEEESKVVWMGCFYYTFTSDFVDSLPEDFTCLPLFLVNGVQGFSNIVETWLQQTFDCYFSPLQISSIHLAWMAAVWSGCSMNYYTDATELTFSVPCLPYPLDIFYAIHPKEAKDLWDSIHSIQGEIKQEEVELFMNSLYKHFHRHFKIYLSSTQLVKVSTPVASVDSLGKIKIYHAQYLMGVLSLFTELALSKIL